MCILLAENPAMQHWQRMKHQNEHDNHHKKMTFDDGNYTEVLIILKFNEKKKLKNGSEGFAELNRVGLFPKSEFIKMILRVSNTHPNNNPMERC